VSGASRKWSRRQLLRGAGLAGAAGAAAHIFPWLRQAQALERPPTPRLVLLMQSNGTLQPSFWPATAPVVLPAPNPPVAPVLWSPILAPIVDVPGLAAKTTALKGLRNDVGGAGNGHDHGFCGLYSGYASMGGFNDPWGSGISIDQHLAKTLTFGEPFPTLNCGVLASDTPPFKAHRRSFSYSAAKQQIPTEFDPYRLYARFFGLGVAVPPGVDPVVATKRRLARKQTVLDHAATDMAALRLRLPKLDREKLDRHADALRDMEARLSATLTPRTDQPPQCTGVRGPAEGLDPRLEDNVPALVGLMFDFIALALSCQLTRIVTFQFGHGGEKWYFRWLKIDENSHDDIAHRDNGQDPVVSNKLLRMNVWYAQQVSRLAQALNALPEGDGTVLDNSLVVWGNEVATGPHGMADIPLVLMGKAAGRIRNPGRLIDAGPQDYRRLGCSLLNVMGVPSTGFGEAPMCGPVAGLELG
jgi:hypothetical protein